MKKHFFIEFFIVLGLFLLSFAIFNMVFTGSSGDSYYQNVIAALIGTLLTIVITSFLLKQQSKSEELREQNVEVFRKKVERFEKFTEILNEILADNIIDGEEVSKIKGEIYSLALFSSKSTISTITKFLRSQLLHDSDEEINVFQVISEFRKDLKLEGLEGFDEDEIAPIINLIDNEFSQLENYQEISSYFKSMVEKLESNLNNNSYHEEVEFLADDVEGSIHKINSNLWSGLANTYNISITYPEDIDDLSLELIIFDYAICEDFSIGDVEYTLTKKLGFEKNAVGEDEPGVQYIKSYPIRYKTDKDGLISINDKSSYKKLANDILDIDEEFFNHLINND